MNMTITESRELKPSFDKYSCKNKNMPGVNCKGWTYVYGYRCEDCVTVSTDRDAEEKSKAEF